MMQVAPKQSLLSGSATWPLWFTFFTIVLDVAALTSIWMGKRHGRPAKIVWTAIVLLVPVLGAIGWFILGRERRRVPR